MRNKSLLVLLSVICIGLFIPKEVFAKNVESLYNTNIDYQFFVDEENTGNLKFKLYDKTGSLSYDSEYDTTTKSFHFFVNDNNYEEYWYYLDGNYNVYVNGFYYWLPNSYYNNGELGIRDYIPYSNELQNLNTINDVKTFLESDEINGRWKTLSYMYNPSHFNNVHDTGLGDIYEFYIYDYIPMILEAFDENNHSILKRIVFASVNIRCCFYNTDYEYYNDESFDKYYIAISLINNTNYWNNENQYIFGNKFLENVNFMRRTMLDYSDELWEELNNGPIASSEIYTNNISSDNYHYLNQSINSSTRNMAEETIEDYAASLPVLSFRKANDINNNNNGEANNILDIVTNPKTWNNGVVILIISLMIIIISSLSLIKKQKH